MLICTNLNNEITNGTISSDSTSETNLNTSEILQKIYPVGSIYTSMNSTNPSDLFGFGTWEQITNRFLYCADSSGNTGGSSTLSVSNLPSHSHTFNGVTATDSVEFRSTSNGNVIENYGKNGILLFKMILDEQLHMEFLLKNYQMYGKY